VRYTVARLAGENGTLAHVARGVPGVGDGRAVHTLIGSTSTAEVDVLHGVHAVEEGEVSGKPRSSEIEYR